MHISTLQITFYNIDISGEDPSGERNYDPAAYVNTLLNCNNAYVFCRRMHGHFFAQYRNVYSTGKEMN
jgi:hypothetical protein